MQTIMVITPTEDLTHYHGCHSVSQHLPTLPSLTHLLAGTVSGFATDKLQNVEKDSDQPLKVSDDYRNFQS